LKKSEVRIACRKVKEVIKEAKVVTKEVKVAKIAKKKVVAIQSLILLLHNFTLMETDKDPTSLMSSLISKSTSR
jgi:hypothetical protein